MKYSYDKSKNGEIIKEFKIEGVMIVITYLDGTKKSLLHTKENELKVLKHMVDQAKMRDAAIGDEVIVKQYEENKKNFCLSTIYTALIFGLSNCLDGTSKKLLFSVGTLISLSVIYNAIELYKSFKMKEETDKYRLYLDIYDKDKDILKLKKEYGIDINNIDNFSLNEVSHIRKRFNKH